MRTWHLRTRREMLCCLGGLAAGASRLGGEAGKAGYRPLFAVQTYIWTQHFSAQKKALGDGLEEIYSATRRAGYTRIELVSALVSPMLRARTAELLRKHRLEASGVYAGGPMHEQALAEKTVADALEVADVAHSLGARTIITNPNPKPGRARKSDDELDTQARFVNRLGEALQQRGMRLLLHHHDPEMAETAREWRHLLNHTDPKLAEICLDLDWIIRGGQAPMALLREAGTRLASLHLRDSRQGVWTEALGEGDYDFRPIAAYLRERRFAGYLVVELAYEKKTQLTRPLEENLRLSRVFAQKTFALPAA